MLLCYNSIYNLIQFKVYNFEDVQPIKKAVKKIQISKQSKKLMLRKKLNCHHRKL